MWWKQEVAPWCGGPMLGGPSGEHDAIGFLFFLNSLRRTVKRRLRNPRKPCRAITRSRWRALPSAPAKGCTPWRSETLPAAARGHTDVLWWRRKGRETKVAPWSWKWQDAARSAKRTTELRLYCCWLWWFSTWHSSFSLVSLHGNRVFFQIFLNLAWNEFFSQSPPQTSI